MPHVHSIKFNDEYLSKHLQRYLLKGHTLKVHTSTSKLKWKSKAAILHMNMLPVTRDTSQKYPTMMCKLTCHKRGTAPSIFKTLDQIEA